MFCSRCGYPLASLPGPCCPECGRGFDPANLETFRDVPPGRITPRQTRLLVINEWCLTVLAGGLAAPLVNYWIARVVLGHEPIPNLDDPKNIPYFGWVAGVCAFVTLMAVPCMLVGTVLPLVIARTAYPRRPPGWWVWRAILPPAAFGVSLLVLAGTPARVWEWWLD